MGKDPLPDSDQDAPRSSRLAAVADFATSLATARSVPEYALHYFDSMAAKFNSLLPPAADDAAAQKAYADARAVVNTPREEVSWNQLVLLELALTRGLAFDELLLKIADLRAKLADSMPPMPEGLAVKLDIATTENLPRLRAEAEALVTRVWLIRMARNARDAYVSELRRNLLAWLLMIIVAFVVLVHLTNKPYAPLFVVIFASGMLGALVSIVRRLQVAVTNSPSPDHSADLSALAHEKRVTVLSMLLGGVFAIILYALFVAGLGELGGQLTPSFSNAGQFTDGGMKFSEFVDKVGPLDGPSYARVIGWSFIAGFFEQFVPDVLDRMTKKK
jgi:hypothetical protein